MSERRFAVLPARATIGIDGPEARGFLQNLVTNDVGRVGPERAVYAALLTPQGKYLFDFFVLQARETLLLECEAARAADLVKRLAMYRLRAKVEIAPRDDLTVAAAYGPGAAAALGLDESAGAARAIESGLAFVDPRLAAAGVRLVAPAGTAKATLAAAGFAAADAADYDRWRLALGLPDGSRDLEVDRTVLLEGNFEELNGVDFHKGCFIGQEVTARTKYRGLIKKRLMRVDVDGPLPPPDTPVELAGKPAGSIRSGADGIAQALLRLDAMESAAAAGQSLSAGGARITPVPSSWQRAGVGP